MANGDDIDAVIGKLSQAIEKAYQKLETSKIDMEAAIDSLREMDRLIVLYRRNLPQREFGARLLESGGNLFNDWVSQHHGCTMNPEAAAKLKEFQSSERPGIQQFIDAVFAMRDCQKDWVYLDDDQKKPDPFFVAVLDVARICRRISDLDLQRRAY